MMNNYIYIQHDGTVICTDVLFNPAWDNRTLMIIDTRSAKFLTKDNDGNIDGYCWSESCGLLRWQHIPFKY